MRPSVSAPTRRGETPASDGSDDATPDPHPLIAGYHVGDELGSGPLGRVYRATKEATGEKVVFRGFAQPAGADGRKWSEARAQFRSLLERHQKHTGDGHPNVQQIVAFGDENGLFWIASEFFEGRTLQHILDTEGAQSLTWAIEVMRQIGSAVDHAGANGLAHTDLTPYNILLVNPPPGESPNAIHVKVINFGLAHARSKYGSRFAAPEQQDGYDGDRRSDVYAAGALMYEILSGRPVFDSMSLEDLVRKIKTSEPVPLSNLPAYVQNVLATMLAKDPRRRYGSILQAIDDLEAGRSPENAFTLGDVAPGALPATALPPGAVGGMLPGAAPLVPGAYPKLDAGDTHRGSAHHNAPWEGKPGEPGSGPGMERIAIQEFSLAEQDLVIARWRNEKAKEKARERRRGRWHAAGMLRFAAGVGVAAALVGHANWMVTGYQNVSVAGATGQPVLTMPDGTKKPLHTGDTVSLGTIKPINGDTPALISCGPNDRLMLDLRGARLHLMEGTVLAIRQNSYHEGPIRRFDLKQGTVVANVDPNHRKGTVFEIDAGALRAVAKGTMYAVTAYGHSRAAVSTDEGAVRTAFGDSRESVAAGTTLQVEDTSNDQASLSSPASSSDSVHSTFTKSRKAMDGVPGGPGSLGTTLAVGEEKLIMPVGEAVSSVIHLPTTIADRKAVLLALGSMSGLMAVLQTTEDAPSSLHLDSLAETGIKSAEKTKLMAAFAGEHLVSYRRLRDGYEVIARAKDSAGTLIRGRNGVASVAGNDDTD